MSKIFNDITRVVPERKISYRMSGRIRTPRFTTLASKYPVLYAWLAQNETKLRRGFLSYKH